MVQNNVSLTPTLTVHRVLIKEGFPHWDNFKKDKLRKLKEVVKVQKENITIAYEEGVNILMGSDCGVIEHGYNLSELKYLVEIGMSPLEAIYSGTMKAAKFLEKEDKIGSIVPGKVADLIMVEDNPLDDIDLLSNPDNILITMQDGRILKNIF
jgi:imidazolonepropionase-like amidohydrolase